MAKNSAHPFFPFRGYDQNSVNIMWFDMLGVYATTETKWQKFVKMQSRNAKAVLQNQHKI